MNHRVLEAAIALVALIQGGSAVPLPTPTGPHAVGVFRRTWIDSTRIDSLLQNPGFREVLLRVWYPATRDSAIPIAPYAEFADRADSAYAALHAAVRNHARESARPSNAPAAFPVVILAPGRSSGVHDYTTLAEDLASHGYVVVGVSSPHHSRIIRPDGTLMPVLFRAVSPASYPHGIDDEQAAMVRLVSADLSAVGQHLQSMNDLDPILRGRLDLNAVGMLGHSNGAMAGSRTCALEPRCLAFLGIEGQQTRELRLGGTDKPYAQLYSDQTLNFDTAGVFTEIRLHARAPYALFSVTGAGHNTFTDLPLVRPGAFRYAIDARRGLELTRMVVRSFFDRHLLGRLDAEAPLEQQSELTVRRFGTTSRSR